MNHLYNNICPVCSKYFIEEKNIKSVNNISYHKTCLKLAIQIVSLSQKNKKLHAQLTKKMNINIKVINEAKKTIALGVA